MEEENVQELLKGIKEIKEKRRSIEAAQEELKEDVRKLQRLAPSEVLPLLEQAIGVGASRNPFVTNKTVGVIGSPLSEGQDWLDGVQLAPKALREGGLHDVITDLGWAVEDVGDVSVGLPLRTPKEHPSNLEYYSEQEIKKSAVIGAACGEVHRLACKLATEGKFVLTLGGDHSTAAGSISGVKSARSDLAVVWVDAHADCNTPETSPSKNYHGMPVGHLLGWFKKRAAGFEWLEEYLKDPLQECRLAYIGLRDIDREEKELLRKSKVHVFSMFDVERLGIAKVMEQILETISPDNSRPLHLSLDIDGIDPTVAPGTGTKAKGGLSYRESHYICRRLAQTGMFSSMDLVEINPSVDPPVSGEGSDDIMHGDNPKIRGTTTVRLGLELIESALGKTMV